MKHNEKFQDLLDSINNKAKQNNFINGITWAKLAEEKEEITKIELLDFTKCHHLRNCMAHGCARDIKITRKTYKIAKRFLNRISNTSLMNNDSSNLKNLQNVSSEKSFTRSFDIKSKDGKLYNFQLEAIYENNYIYKEGNQTGYFIHIRKAPFLRRACKNIFKYNMLKSRIDNTIYIKWDNVIETAYQANNIMTNWAKDYLNRINVM